MLTFLFVPLYWVPFVARLGFRCSLSLTLGSWLRRSISYPSPFRGRFSSVTTVGNSTFKQPSTLRNGC